MLPKLKSSRPPSQSQAGFTIVETLIVLAIAGFILLLVFDAIPALNRSGRNNQRRQDVQTVLRAVSQYELNNSGDFPPNCGGSSPTPSCIGSGHLLANVRLTYYDQVVVRFEPVSTPLGSAAQTTDINTVYVYNHQLCDSNNSATDAAAGYSDVVALYATENANAANPQCQQL
jgi:prepilin-type N-terminal cleavage/methylation domain-containing protein